MTKVVILAGGKGTRLQELTGEIPKPLLKVGDKPIVQHIIDRFVACGFNDFIIPVGYLGEKVIEYFTSTPQKEGVAITEIDTGLETQTGGRLLRLKSDLSEPFMMTYGDGLSNINPKYVKEMGEEVDKNIITAVHPPARFGSMTISPEGEVVSFTEKVINPRDWINGGFFYLKPEIFNYIHGDMDNFERDVLPKVVWESGLHAFQYEGLWHCIDVMRDLELANEMWKKGMFKNE